MTKARLLLLLLGTTTLSACNLAKHYGVTANLSAVPEKYCRQMVSVDGKASLVVYECPEYRIWWDSVKTATRTGH